MNIEKLVGWILLTPITLCYTSKHKWVRVLGLLLVFPWALTWIVTGLPILLLIIIHLFIELIKLA